MKVILTLVLAAVTTAVFAQSPLLVTTYRYADNARINNIKPFADHLSTACGCKTEVKSYESVGAMLAGMQASEPDMVFMNTFGYLLLRENPHAYQTAAALQLARGKISTYQATIATNRTTNLKSLQDLALHRERYTLRLVNPGSTSGNLVPRIGLAAVGITDAERFFREVTYSKNHGLALQEVAEGTYDVAAFGSEEYDKLTKSNPELAARVQVLWTSGDIPLGPVVYKKTIDKKMQRCLTHALLQLHKENKAALESVKAGWTEAIPADRYLRITDRHYIEWLQQTGPLDQIMPIIRKFAQ
jgi:phosphate/phosphite/phosphonate ABC transporter binding protein